MTEHPYAELVKGYPRNIIGFDVRVEPSIHQTTDILQGSWLHRPAMRVTFEELVWQKLLDEHVYDGYGNGIGLLVELPSNLNELSQIEGATLAAFDMPEVYATWLASGMFGIHSLPMSIVTNNSEHVFEFCGYDIFSVRTWHSYFYSGDTETSEIVEAQQKHAFEINSWGLVTDEDVAIRIAEAFTEEWDEIYRQRGHERGYDPFAPCGIWIKKIGKSSGVPSP